MSPVKKFSELLRIESDGTACGTKIIHVASGVDISDIVRSVHIDIRGHNPPMATVELIPCEFRGDVQLEKLTQMKLTPEPGTPDMQIQIKSQTDFAQEVRTIVHQAIASYDADKRGR